MRSLIATTVAALCLALAVPGFAQTGTAAPDAATPSAEVKPLAEVMPEAAPATEEAAAPAAEADASGEPAYAGTWAEDEAQCSKTQDVEDAPMVITKDRFDQHEAHCEFKSVSGNANEWKVTSECSVEGDKQTYEFGMSVADKKLAMVDDAGAHIYSRCE